MAKIIIRAHAIRRVGSYQKTATYSNDVNSSSRVISWRESISAAVISVMSDGNGVRLST